MNCANHPDRERVAFCQNCGKPLCSECVRTVGNSIYCEPCFVARTTGRTTGVPNPGSGYPAPGPVSYPPTAPDEPNPGLAALLGFIPGVGAMYNGQYAKGIVHLIVFAILVSLASDVNGIFGLFIAGWIFYMVIEAHHTARARRDGTPLPNPFGLNDLSERLGFGRAWPNAAPYSAPADPARPASPPEGGPAGSPPGAYFHQGSDGSQTYSAPGAYFHQGADGSQTYATPPVSHWGAPQDGYGVPPVPPVSLYPDPNLSYHRRFPSGAIWLIAIGAFFMLGNIPMFHIFHGRLFMPILLMGFGVWLFVRKMVSTGPGLENDGTPLYHWRLTSAIYSSFWVILTGFIWLLDALHILSWGRSWPLYVIAAGVMAIFRRSSYPGGYGYSYTPQSGVPTPPPAPPPVTSTGLVPTDPGAHPPTDTREGR